VRKLCRDALVSRDRTEVEIRFGERLTNPDACERLKLLLDLRYDDDLADRGDARSKVDQRASVAKSEVGLEPVNRMAYYGIYAPKGTPKEVVDKISAAAKKALEDANVRKRIEETGSLVVANSPAEFADQIKAEFEIYKKIVQAQNLKLD
jgi:hypothetical protein